VTQSKNPKAETGTSGVLFVGGSTMRGFSKGKMSTPYPELLMSRWQIDAQIYARDLITASRALEVIETSLPFDTLVIQIGVADSLREMNPRVKGILDFFARKLPDFSSVVSQSNPVSVYDFMILGKKRRFLKALTYSLNVYSHKTSLKVYRNCVMEIQDFATAHGIKIIWLGSILGSSIIPRMEVRKKAKYCKFIFDKLSREPQYENVFIDVEKLLSDFVSIEDPFHLTDI
jgi:hypothetical protein